MSTSENFPDRIESWDDLSLLIEHFSFFSAHAWLFRGVTDATHDLVPKIGRPSARKRAAGGPKVNGARVPYSLEDERAVFEMFKQQARSYLPSPPTTDFEWMAVAQHYGLPTSLLDWTESLFVAAWFAVEKGGGKASGADSAIWVTRGSGALDPNLDVDPFEVADVKVYRPPYISPRISAQASALMLCPNPTLPVKPAFCRKVSIARKAEFLIKKRLNACGVNRRQLFPDLAGLADHIGWLYKQDYLAGYRRRASGDIHATGDDSPQDPE